MRYNQGVKVLARRDTNMRPHSHAFHPTCRDSGLALEAQRNVAFCVSSVRARIDVANGPCRGCTHKPMRLLASQRENLQAVSQEQSRTVIWRLAPRRRALWKLKPDLMGAVVQYRMAEVGGITRLACLMEKRENR
jgi:hypothetical protein